jgi:hypothetical protein
MDYHVPVRNVTRLRKGVMYCTPKCPSVIWVKAANLVCRAVDIVRQTVTALKQIHSDFSHIAVYWFIFYVSFMRFAPCVLIQFYRINQRISQFSNLIFHFCCLLHVSKLASSSTGRQSYMQYGIYYVHRSEHSGGQEECVRDSTCLQKDETKRFRNT